METAQLARPVRGNLIRTERLFIFGLVAILTLGLASPAQAGLGDLIDGLLDPVEELPVLGEIVDPVVGGIVDPVVDPLIEDVFTPAVENVVAPIVEPVVEEVLPPVVDEVVPPIDQIEVPPLIDDVTTPPIESITVPGTSGRADSPTIRTSFTNLNDPAPARENLPNGSTHILGNGNGNGRSLVLAHALQTALVGTAGTPPTVAGRLADSTGAGWLMGLTDWLRGTANGLADLLSIPLRLLELLARALLTAGSGLVAPASLALAFTIYAVRDRRWQRIRKTALN
jgi:hypothetical protein